MTDRRAEFDVVIVGAGFAGLYALHKARSAGFSVKLMEAGSDVGGTWYWNRYPGARCDVESVDYSYSFLPELEQEWRWSARYATQVEILSYLRHVAERFDLRRDIQFDTRVTGMEYDAATGHWTLRSEQGDEASARFCIMATGCLSSAQTPALPGAGEYAGHVYHTGTWPGPVDFGGQRVGVIGTGSSGIQVIPEVAAQAEHLYVFQRTPNFSMPARDRPLDPETERELKANYRQRRAAARRSPGGLPEALPTVGVHEVDDTERMAILERAWTRGATLCSFPSPTSCSTRPPTTSCRSSCGRRSAR